jgi:hypothetical protein
MTVRFTDADTDALRTQAEKENRSVRDVARAVVQTVLGEAQLSDRCRQAVERSKSSGNVIMGIRPEHFEDASLVGDKPGGTFDAPIDIVEAMGSDVFAYFVMTGEEAHSEQLDDLAKDAGNDLHSDGVPVTARLDDASHVPFVGAHAYRSCVAMTVQFTDADTDALRAQAEKENRSMQDVARAAIREYLGRRGHAELLDREVRRAVIGDAEVPVRPADDA